MRDPSSPPAALQRLHARRRNPRTWHPDDLERLEEAYAACPKLWWHVGAVVPAQVDLVTTARVLRQLPRLSASLLDAVAQADDRREVSDALQLLLRLVAHRRPSRAWTSLQDAALTFLHADEGRYDPPGAVPALLALAPWATPLTTRDALANHGRLLNTCLGERAWWRLTALGLGRAYAVDWKHEAATLWLVPHPTLGAQVELLTGPDNAAVSDDLQAAVDTALDAALARTPRPFARPAAQQGLPPVTEEALHRARHALLDAAGPGWVGPPPVARAPRTPDALPGLPLTHWTECHAAFAWPARFGVDSIVVAPGGDDDTPLASVAWDPTTGGIAYTTPQGPVTLLPTSPPTLLRPTPSPLGDGAPSPAALWFTLDVAGAREDGLPDAAVQAMACFRLYLPPRVVAAARTHEAFRSLPGVWLLCSVPGLQAVVAAAPCLADAVVEHTRRQPETTAALAAIVAQGSRAAQVQAVLAWLGVPQARALASQLSALGPGFWSAEALRACGSLLGVPPAAGLLGRLHRWLPAHVQLLAAARAAGLLHQVTLRLLTDVRAAHGGPWMRSRLETAFAELAASAAETGRAPPRIQGLAHLARLLVLARPRVPAPPPPPASLPGPWGTPVTDPGALAGLARELGHDPERWQRALLRGHLCCLGLPAGQITVTWLQASGRRGALQLGAALDTTGAPAPPAVRIALEEGLQEHHRLLAELEPGWCGEEALAAGLSLDLGQITLAGRRPLGDLVESVLSLGR